MEEAVVESDEDQATVEKFARSGGTVIAVLGGLIAAAFLVGWALDMDGVPLWVPAASLLGGVLIWTSTLRPRVLVESADLVLRNMLSTIRIPLAAIDEIAVRQVLAVRAGGKRYVCSGTGRSMRQAMRGSPMQKAREQAGSLTGEVPVEIGRGIQYADFVETRIQELIRKDRNRRGIRAYTPETEELATQIRREWAWPEIAALAGTTVFLVVAIIAN
jgi:hypothetical protein